MAMLELKGVAKSFHDGDSELQILRGIDLVLEPSSSLGLMGASGSGKSTLLQIAAGLEKPDAGQVLLLGESLPDMSQRDLALLRRRRLGFVFQQFNLLPGLTVRDNLLFQRRLAGLPENDGWVDDIIGELELASLLGRQVARLSGGEQQRVAIARALAHKPQLIFADEPTGNLHDRLSRQVMAMFSRLLEESGCCLLLVTHSRAIAVFTQRQVLLEEGKLHASSEDAS
jgi:putative ABC transport system ATP-binding protein